MIDQLHSVESEQTILGALLIDNSTCDLIADKVSATDFARRDHRIIFEAITTLSEAGQPFDPIILKEHLDQRGKLDEVGGLAYLGTLSNCTPTASNIVAYAKIVRDKAIERHLNHAATKISEIVHGPGDMAEKLDQAQALIMSVAEQGQQRGNGPVIIGQGLSDELDELDACFQNGGPISGLKTGFIDLDDRTTGFHGGELIIIAGRPAMGKTSFAMNIAEHVALAGNSVVVFSMEMQKRELTKRMMTSLARIDFQRYRSGKLEEPDWSRVTSATGKLKGMPLFIDESPGLNVTELRARARRLKREHGIKLIVVDYLQLMSGQGEARRDLEISTISRNLKALAKELNIPVVALSQLSRKVEERPNKRPIMSDLRESGAIEQDADVIMMLYRDEEYNPDSPDKGLAELIIRKQRNGPTGKVNLIFRGDFLRFESYAGPMPSTIAP